MVGKKEEQGCREMRDKRPGWFQNKINRRSRHMNDHTTPDKPLIIPSNNNVAPLYSQ